jgi:mono/diheme cytochrome c family protein
MQSKKMLATGFLALCFSATLMAQTPGANNKSTGNAAKPDNPGRELYHSYCAACHGNAGKGDGPVAAYLRKAPSDLTLLAKKNGGKFPGAQVTKELKDIEQAPHGSTEMPIWGPIFTEISPRSEALGTLRITNVVRYLESIQAK